MGRSRVSWALSVVAPWCLGMGLVVSFTADAGHDTSIGASRALLNARSAQMPIDLIAGAPPGSLAQRLRQSNSGLVKLAALSIGEPQDLLIQSDEIDPRRDLKRNASIFPAPDRSHKGDPAVGLRPTFDAKLRQRGLAAAHFDDLLFDSTEYLAFSGFSPLANPIFDASEAAAFGASESEFASGATAPATGASSPAQAGTAPALVAAAPLKRGAIDGATPATPRATALASTTPTAPDQAAIEVVALPAFSNAPAKSTPLSTAPNSTRVARANPQPDYAASIDQTRTASEERCLAEAIYFEARSEPEAGQAAVAQVVLNRVQSGLYPTNVCGVVYQNRHRHLACQFSFACEGKSLRITEPEPWRIAVRIAGEVLNGKTYLSDVGASTHYHANYVRPRWSRLLKKTDTIGSHVFYQLRPGQT